MKEFNFSNDLIAAFDLAISQFGSFNNVFLIDIGNKYIDNVRQATLCVRIHTEGTDPHNSTNPLIQFIEYGNFGKQQHRKILPVNSQRTIRKDTVQPGMSFGYSESGTLGLICYDKRNPNNICLLTAAHVIPGPVGDSVSQPGGGLDRGNSKFHGIGNILRTDPNGDAAIALFNNRRRLDLRQFESNNIIDTIRRVKIGDILSKSGRTTGITDALVDGIGVFFKRSRSSIKAIKGFRLVPLDGQDPRVTEISDNGDSGAVWFDRSKTNEGIGLLFAGEKSSDRSDLEFSFAQHLSDVFSNLQISLNTPT